jgi:hypothetical protein
LREKWHYRSRIRAVEVADLLGLGEEPRACEFFRASFWWKIEWKIEGNRKDLL